MLSTSKHAGSTIEPSDSRRAARYLMGGPVACTAGKVVNLSSHGALVVSRAPHLAEQIVFQLSDGATTFRCRAKVLRTSVLGPTRYNCALEFEDVSSEQRASLERLMGRYRIAGSRQDRDAA